MELAVFGAVSAQSGASGLTDQGVSPFFYPDHEESPFEASPGTEEPTSDLKNSTSEQMEQPGKAKARRRKRKRGGQ